MSYRSSLNKRTVSDENKNATNNHTLSSALSSGRPLLYIILTRQRSGSTWLSDLLGIQDGISCGGKKKIEWKRFSELMGGDDYNISDWPTYQYHMARAFNECIEASYEDSSDPMAAGFKLMCDHHVPQKYIENGAIFDEFAKYNLTVIHLVREAKILRYESVATMSEVIHTSNATLAQQIREEEEMIQWDDHIVQEIKREENSDDLWEDKLRVTPGIRYHRVAYEELLNKEEFESELFSILSFLTKDEIKRSSMKSDSSMQELHKPTCVGRIEKYEEFRRIFEGTREADVCDMLDSWYENDEVESSRRVDK